ncbi:MAG: U32 family peptidase [Bacteriovoracaceae bacterium]|nr:U32 family peptidase [Bacteriovoracaceae bacterium]
MVKIPEILAPAGNLEKLKVAVLYGADAVYLGGMKFGLRSAADNFTNAEIEEAVAFAHKRGVLVYVVLNSFLHDKEIEELPPFVQFLHQVGIDAVIVSDLGVLQVVRQCSKLKIHLSTQGNCINAHSALFWKQMGVTRVILGREVSIQEAAKIKKISGLEVEIFIHGSMCIAYSGNCTISNYTKGRDSNRGGCAHSCRFEYTLDFQDRNVSPKSKTCFFMSSKDLNGIEYLTEATQAGIDSLKIEGRMKGHLYVGTLAKTYKEALLYIKQNQKVPSKLAASWNQELLKVTHRDYTSANLGAKASFDSIYSDREHEGSDFIVVGFVVEVVPEEFILVEVRNAFYKGDYLELLPFKGKAHSINADKITNVLGEEYTKTKPGTLVKLSSVEGAEVYNILRKREVT